MDGYYYSSDSPDDAAVPSPPGDHKPTSQPLPSPSSPPPPPPPPPPTTTTTTKRSRRSVQKRVVSVPIAEADPSRPKGSGEAGPPSDSWAWRKYGQKPIKGSPYPRGYYRCSSSKGCPARKQVERSRVDPTTLVITYSFDHNHPWPVPKNHHHLNPKPPARPAEEREPEAGREPARPGPDEPEEEERFADLFGEEFESWGAEEEEEEVMLYGPMYSAALLPEERGEWGRGDEDDALFAGLGELPECAVVFRRGNGFNLAPEPCRS